MGDAGIIVPAKDSQAIAIAVAELLDNSDKRDAMSAAGRQRIEQLFCWTRAAQQMTDYYTQVLEGNTNHANG